MLMFAPLDNSNLQVSLCPYRAAKMIAGPKCNYNNDEITNVTNLDIN